MKSKNLFLIIGVALAGAATWMYLKNKKKK